MSVCKNCGFVGGWHYPWCIHPNPQKQPPTRVEYFGRLQVHQPFDYSQPLPPMPHYRPREWETQETEHETR